jgi:hypothetical protein
MVYIHQAQFGGPSTPYVQACLVACEEGGGLDVKMVDAIMRGDEKTVREMTSRDDFDMHSTGTNGEHYLGLTIAMANLSLAQLLTRRKANVLLGVDGYGMPSEMAAKFGRPQEMIDFLFSKENCKNARCRGAGAKKCQGCKQVRYCGTSCQRSDWRAHKAECRPKAALQETVLTVDGTRRRAAGGGSGLPVLVAAAIEKLERDQVSTVVSHARSNTHTHTHTHTPTHTHPHTHTHTHTHTRTHPHTRTHTHTHTHMHTHSLTGSSAMVQTRLIQRTLQQRVR